MPKTKIIIIIFMIIVFGALVLPKISWAATRLLYEDLDDSASVSDVVFDEVWRATLAGSLQTASPSPQGGKYVHAILSPSINNAAPGYGYNRLGGTSREVYWKQWMRVGTNIDDNNLEGLKAVIANDYDETGQMGNWVYVGPATGGFFYAQATGGDISWYFGNPQGMSYGTWILWEYYIKANDPGQSNGIIRVWKTVSGDSRILVGEETGMNMFDNTDVKFKTVGGVYHFKSPLGGPYYPDGSPVDIDGFEIWDGMPNIQPDTTPPAAPMGVTVS